LQIHGQDSGLVRRAEKSDGKQKFENVSILVAITMPNSEICRMSPKTNFMARKQLQIQNPFVGAQRQIYEISDNTAKTL
jgi:hypothetical protein